MLGNINSIGKSPSFKAVLVDKNHIKKKLDEKQVLQYKSGKIKLKGLGEFSVENKDDYIIKDPITKSTCLPMDDFYILKSKAFPEYRESLEIDLTNLYVDSKIDAMYWRDDLILNREQSLKDYNQGIRNLKALKAMHQPVLREVSTNSPPQKSKSSKPAEKHNINNKLIKIYK
ncbi:MAG: hypothetical protein A2Y25_09765 [Candidatus Melainabacteria bacterium GWF2_37_15]|nr:MAG: hypothetical protein A2Y25_09765 [Candidatus Melainabacteria bacterium GWF2_37_15]